MIKGDIGGEGQENRVRSLEGRTKRDLGPPPPYLAERLQGQRERPEYKVKPTSPLVPIGDFGVADDCASLLVGGERVSTARINRALLGGQGQPLIYREGQETAFEKSSAAVILRLPEGVRIETAISEKNPDIDDPATDNAYSMHQDILHTIFWLQDSRTKYNNELIAPETRFGYVMSALRENPEMARGLSEVVNSLEKLTGKAQSDEKLAQLASDLLPTAKPLHDEEMESVLRENPEMAELISDLEKLKRRVQSDEKLARVVSDLLPIATGDGYRELARNLNELEKRHPYSEERFGLGEIQLSHDKQGKPVLKTFYHASSYWEQQANVLGWEVTGKLQFFPYKTGVLVAVETADEKIVIGMRSAHIDKGGVRGVVAEALSRKDTQDPEQDKTSPPDPSKNAIRGLEEELGILPEHVVGEKDGIHFDLVLANHDGGTDLLGHVKLKINEDKVKELWSNAHDGQEMDHVPSIDFTSAEKFARYMIPDDGPRSWLHGVPELLYDMACRKFGKDEVKRALRAANLARMWGRRL